MSIENPRLNCFDKDTLKLSKTDAFFECNTKGYVRFVTSDQTIINLTPTFSITAAAMEVAQICKALKDNPKIGKYCQLNPGVIQLGQLNLTS